MCARDPAPVRLEADEVRPLAARQHGSRPEARDRGVPPGQPAVPGQPAGIRPRPCPARPTVWGIDASACGLTDGKVYHYWFEVTDSSPSRDGSRILCTDPTAFTVDWRLQAPPPPAAVQGRGPGPGRGDQVQGRQARPLRRGAGRRSPPPSRSPRGRPEQPDRHLRTPDVLGPDQRRRATRRSGSGPSATCSLWSTRPPTAANFGGTPALRAGPEPPAGARGQRPGTPAGRRQLRRARVGLRHEQLPRPGLRPGLPGRATPPRRPNTDLVALVNACHARGIRFIIDVVMAFGTRAAMENVNFDEFHIDPGRCRQRPRAAPVEQPGGPRRLRRQALAVRAGGHGLRPGRRHHAGASSPPASS